MEEGDGLGKREIWEASLKCLLKSIVAATFRDGYGGKVAHLLLLVKTQSLYRWNFFQDGTEDGAKIYQVKKGTGQLPTLRGEWNAAQS